MRIVQKELKVIRPEFLSYEGDEYKIAAEWIERGWCLITIRKDNSLVLAKQEIIDD